VLEDGSSIPGALGAAEIGRLLGADPPLVAGMATPELQVQPNGVDLCLDSVWQPQGGGQLGRQIRVVPERHRVVVGPDDWFQLAPGAYVGRLVETVALPAQVMALGFARSSLLRSGCAVINAVWDAGYVGRSEVLLVVHNTAGYAIQRGARIVQLVFFRLTERTQPYAGAYQGENLAP
jgi:dUTP pyrophosphatase